MPGRMRLTISILTSVDVELSRAGDRVRERGEQPGQDQAANTGRQQCFENQYDERTAGLAQSVLEQYVCKYARQEQQRWQYLQQAREQRSELCVAFRLAPSTRWTIVWSEHQYQMPSTG